MTTPEGAVKAKVRELLALYVGIYEYWPVPSGYGRTTLDCLGCYRGRFFVIETKAPGKKPTLRQIGKIAKIERAMGRTFVIDDVDSPVLDELRAWLNELTVTIDDDFCIPPDPVARRPI
jgi:hypothetical protein